MNTPSFNHERTYWQQGLRTIAGLDEAGMGALAGPVVAAAVVFARDAKIENLRDSKQLSAKKREILVSYIKERSIGWSIGEASVDEISQYNIRQAALLAMARAVSSLPRPAEHALIDGNTPAPELGIPFTNIIKGDQKSWSIAAASILAKVHRDAIMTKIDEQFPVYGFASHKGYGSAAHLVALKEHGACAHHRPTYAPVANLTKS